MAPSADDDDDDDDAPGVDEGADSLLERYEGDEGESLAASASACLTFASL